jgi:predicted amidophosphoribosyltransferase
MIIFTYLFAILFCVIGFLTFLFSNALTGGITFAFGVVFWAAGNQMDKSRSLRLESKKCPRCAELVKKEALLCRFCQFEFPPIAQSVPIGPAPKPARDPSVIMPGDIPNPRVKNCPGCGQDLMREAVRCRHCGHEFEPRLIAARRR